MQGRGRNSVAIFMPFAALFWGPILLGSGSNRCCVKRRSFDGQVQASACVAVPILNGVYTRCKVDFVWMFDGPTNLDACQRLRQGERLLPDEDSQQRSPVSGWQCASA